MVQALVTIDNNTNRVLNVIKAKFDLNDKSEAINKLADLTGDDFVEKEAKDQYLKEIIQISEDHIKKYGFKTMTLKELDALCDIK